jgi:hypothetical protein
LVKSQTFAAAAAAAAIAVVVLCFCCDFLLREISARSYVGGELF